MNRPPLEVADLVRAAGRAFIEHSRRWITWATGGPMVVIKSLCCPAPTPFSTVSHRSRCRKPQSPSRFLGASHHLQPWCALVAPCQVGLPAFARKLPSN